MRNAGPLARIAALAENFDAPTLRQAIEDFEPAIPVTAEAFVIGVAALALGWSTTHFSPCRSGANGGAGKRKRPQRPVANRRFTTPGAGGKFPNWGLAGLCFSASKAGSPDILNFVLPQRPPVNSAS
jgi:Protein of unknown function (DUF2937)